MRGPIRGLMVKANQSRQSGETAAQQLSREASRISQEPLGISEGLVASPMDLEPHKRRFRSPNFQRLRVDWSTEDQITLTKAREAANKRLQKEFADAFHIMNRLYDVIRLPILIDGKPKRDENGWIVWQIDEYNYPIENWERLTHSIKDDLLYSITSKLFNWEQLSQDAWAEAMYSRANWEHAFSEAFDELMAGTVQDREARGRLGSVDERLFAVFLSTYSRKTEALVRSMDRLALRLRDTLRT